MAGALPNGIRTSDLKSRVLHLAQSSVYQVKIVPPPGVIDLLRSRGLDYTIDSPNIELLCKDVDLPGSNLQTFEVYDDFAGVTEKMVQRRDHGDSIRMSFYVDVNYKVIDVFEGWMDYITNQIDPNVYKSKAATYRMRYPEQYRGQLFITKFEKDAYGTADTYSFVAAFPSAIKSTPLSYSQSQIMELQVVFTYMRYVREKGQWKPKDNILFDNGAVDFARLNRIGLDSDGNTRPGTFN